MLLSLTHALRGAKGRAEDGMIYVVNLLNGEGLAKIVENLVKILQGLCLGYRAGGLTGCGYC